MRAATILAPGRVQITEVEPPCAGPDAVLVKVLACGVCGSDLNAWRGVPGIQYPLPAGQPGHEVWGEVAEVGAEAYRHGFEVGQRVTGMLQGGYAQYALARPDDLVLLAESDMVLGEPLACAANVARRARVQPGEAVAVVGFGYLAALVLQLLFPRNEGEWVVVTRRAESRELALRMGAREVHGFDDVPARWWDSFPVVMEAAGVQQALDYATWLTAQGGRLVVAGYHADGSRTVNMQSWNWKGIDVINAHERRPEVYAQGLREGLAIVRRHALDLSGLVSHRWPLDDAQRAFETADRRPGDYVKGALLPWDA